MEFWAGQKGRGRRFKKGPKKGLRRIFQGAGRGHAVRNRPRSITSPSFVERVVMAPDIPKVDPDRHPDLGDAAWNFRDEAMRWLFHDNSLSDPRDLLIPFCGNWGPTKAFLPQTLAGSDGRRNTCLQSGCRSLETQGFSGTLIQPQKSGRRLMPYAILSS
jgi:hypothetical protein